MKEYLVKTFHGLEQVLADELKELGGSDIEIKKRAVACKGDQAFLYRAVLGAGSALRILMPFAKIMVHNERDLYKKVKRIPWEEFIGHQQTFAIDSISFSDLFRHSNFLGLRVKDALVDHMRDIFGSRPSVDSHDPDVRFNAHISDKWLTLSVDCTGKSMHLRGYRDRNHYSPINEVLAHGMIKLSGWKPGKDFLDPMCGSGTLAIEAARIAAGIPANRDVEDFALTKFPDFDAELWEKQKRNLTKKPIPTKIVASDEDHRSVRMAREIARNAGVEQYIEFESEKFSRLSADIKNGWILMNPPYGERLKLDKAAEFYKGIGDVLKSDYSHQNQAWVISSNLGALKHLGLRPTRKIQLYNGKLECKWQKYELYQGSKKRKD